MARENIASAEMTAWDYGFNYGSFLISQSRGEYSPKTLTINLSIRPLPCIPNEDYREMRDSGIETDPLEYWKGFNHSLA